MKIKNDMKLIQIWHNNNSENKMLEVSDNEILSKTEIK